MITALLIDDEPLAHKVVLHHLKDHKDVTVVKQCFNAAEAMSYLASHEVDLLFLDINMPQLTGIDMLRVLANRPQVIIISAHKEYAFDSFELDVTDYVAKPVSAERFAIALEKVRAKLQFSDQPNNVEQMSDIMLKVDRNMQKFPLADITLLEAYGNYVQLWQSDNMTLITATLKQLNETLPSEQFIQVHKSYIVNKTAITTVGTDWIRLSNDRQIGVGRSFKSEIRKLFEQ